ncbi:hypothetical protein ACMYSQ_000121 [Aspergillus niger]
MTMIATCEQIDESWGPWAQSCRGGFDFTLTFEDTILIILPSILFIVASLIGVLCGRERRQLLHATPYLSTCKPLAVSLYTVLRLASLILWSRTPIRVRTSIAAEVIYFVTAFPLAWWSYRLHRTAVAPSLFLSLFLSVTIVFQAVRIRSLWLMQRDTGLAIVETISLAVTVVLARAEARTKPHHLPTAALATLSREQLSGLYGRGLFLWLARTLWDGNKRSLKYSDLFGMYDAATAGHNNTRFGQYSRLSQVQGSKATSLL